MSADPAVTAFKRREEVLELIEEAEAKEALASIPGHQRSNGDSQDTVKLLTEATNLRMRAVCLDMGLRAA